MRLARGAYPAARLTQQSPLVSANAGNQLAATVILHRGAIIPRHVMPTLV